MGDYLVKSRLISHFGKGELIPSFVSIRLHAQTGLVRIRSSSLAANMVQSL